MRANRIARQEVFSTTLNVWQDHGGRAETVNALGLINNMFWLHLHCP